MYVNRHWNLKRKKCDVKEAMKILKYKDLTIEIQHMQNVKHKGDTSNKRAKWDYFSRS